MKWRSMKTAPKDGMEILLNIGYSFPVVGAWNNVSEKWCYANLAVDQFHGKFMDTYFESEYADEKDAKGWIPMPKIKDCI